MYTNARSLVQVCLEVKIIKVSYPVTATKVEAIETGPEIGRCTTET